MLAKRVRCALVGDTQVGKTSLLKSYSSPKVSFSETYTPTKTWDRYSIKLEQNGKEILLECWDVGEGHSSFFKLHNDVDCFLVCFSIASPTTLSTLKEKYVDPIKEKSPPSIVFLVGCKSDLRKVQDKNESNNDFVTFKEGKEKSQILNAQGYVECSSGELCGVREVFDEAITAVLMRAKKAYDDEEDDFGFLNGSFSYKPREDTNITLLEKIQMTVEESEEQTTKHPTFKENRFLRSEDQSLLELLSKGNFSSLFSEEIRGEFLKEFRNRNPELIRFLSSPSQISDLIKLIIEDSENVSKQFCACEILTADIAPILDNFSQLYLWDELFTFFQLHKPPLDNSKYLTANYFVRVVSFLINNRSVEFMMYISENPDTLSNIVNYLGHDCFGQLLLAIVDCENLLNSIGFSKRCTSDLIPTITTRIERREFDSPEVAGLRNFIHQILQKYPSSFPLIQEILKSDFCRVLISASLNEDYSSNESIDYLEILMDTLSIHCKNQKEYENMEPPKIIQDTLTTKLNDSDETPFCRLQKILSTPCKFLPTTITTSAGTISPLGPFRLKCIEFTLLVLQLNFYLVDTAIVESRILPKCIDLFFQCRWNNILHSLVLKVAILILESKPPFLSLHLLRDCHLLDRIIQAQQNEEQEKSMKTHEEKFTPHQGYMAHLLQIANSIVKSARLNSSIFYLIEDFPNRRGWKRIEEKLAK